MGYKQKFWVGIPNRLLKREEASAQFSILSCFLLLPPWHVKVMAKAPKAALDGMKASRAEK